MVVIEMHFRYEPTIAPEADGIAEFMLGKSNMQRSQGCGSSATIYPQRRQIKGAPR
jgi:hypothetical protein